MRLSEYEYDDAALDDLLDRKTVATFSGNSRETKDFWDARADELEPLESGSPDEPASLYGYRHRRHRQDQEFDPLRDDWN